MTTMQASLTALDGVWDPASLFDEDLNTDLLASLPTTPEEYGLSLTGPAATDLDFVLEDVFSSDSALTPDLIERNPPFLDESGESSIQSGLGVVPGSTNIPPQAGLASSDHSLSGTGLQQPFKGVSPTSSSGGGAASDSSIYRQAFGDKPGATQQPKQTGGKQEEDEVKRAIRMARNRENAHLSRQRKKAQMSSLEQQCGVLTHQVRALTGMVGQLSAENSVLRAHLEATCASAGVPLPAGLPPPREPQLVMKPPAAPGAAPTMALALVPKGSGVTGALNPSIGVAAAPQVVTGTSVASAPAPPPANSVRVTVEPPGPVTDASQDGPSGRKREEAPSDANRRKSKRRRGVVAGSSAAFLALFSIFLLASAPSWHAERPAKIGSSLLPVSSFDPGLQHRGRVLQSVSDDGQELPSDQINSGSGQYTSPLEGALASLAPLVLSVDAASDQLNLQSAVPQLAASVFEGWGLEPPRLCRRLQTFRTGDGNSPDHQIGVAPELKRELVRYLKGHLGLKGRGPNAVRILHPPSHLLALPDPRATAVAAAPEQRCTGEAEKKPPDEEAEDDVIPEVSEPVVLTAVVPARNLSSSSFLPVRPKVDSIDNDSALIILALEPGRQLSIFACDLVVPRDSLSNAGRLSARLF